MKRNLLLLFAFALIGLSAKAQTSWTTLNSGTTANLYCIQFLDANNGFAGGGGNGIAVVIKTHDGGNSWQAINIPSNFPVRSIYFTSTDSGWAVTGDVNSYTNTGTIWVTGTGGATWNSITWPGTPYGNLSVQVNSGKVWVGATHNTTSTGQDVYYSTDDGTTWTANPASIDWIWQYGLHFYDSMHGWVAGDNQTNGLINYTADGGTTWTQQYTLTNFLYGINFQDNMTGYAVGDHATLLRTTNAGTSWNAISNPLTSDTLYSITLAMNGMIDLIVGSSGSTLWSSNNGITWVTGPSTQTTQSLNSVTNAALINGSQFWVCGDSGVIITNSIVEGIPAVNNSQANISIYPNPSDGNITVTQLGIRNYELGIYDMLGNEVYHQPLSDASPSTINVSFLNNGNYLWEVKSDRGTIDKGKITIAK